MGVGVRAMTARGRSAPVHGRLRTFAFVLVTAHVVGEKQGHRVGHDGRLRPRLGTGRTIAAAAAAVAAVPVGWMARWVVHWGPLHTHARARAEREM